MKKVVLIVSCLCASLTSGVVWADHYKDNSYTELLPSVEVNLGVLHELRQEVSPKKVPAHTSRSKKMPVKPKAAVDDISSLAVEKKPAKPLMPKTEKPAPMPKKEAPMEIQPKLEPKKPAPAPKKPVSPPPPKLQTPKTLPAPLPEPEPMTPPTPDLEAPPALPVPPAMPEQETPNSSTESKKSFWDKLKFWESSDTPTDTAKEVATPSSEEESHLPSPLPMPDDVPMLSEPSDPEAIPSAPLAPPPSPPVAAPSSPIDVPEEPLPLALPKSPEETKTEMAEPKPLPTPDPVTMDAPASLPSSMTLPPEADDIVKPSQKGMAVPLLPPEDPRLVIPSDSDVPILPEEDLPPKELPTLPASPEMPKPLPSKVITDADLADDSFPTIAPPALPKDIAKTTSANALSTATDQMLSLTFSVGDSVLSDKQLAELDSYYNSLDLKDRLKLKIIGHATSKDPSDIASARRMSLQRVIAVRKFFIDKGMDASQLTVQALGSAKEGPSDIVVVSRSIS